MVPKQIGRFKVAGELTKAAYGNIYKAVDPRTGRVVAIRLIAADSPALPKLQETLRQAQVLDSRNIVRVLGLGDFEGASYVVTEFVQGRTLRSLLSGETMSVWDVMDITRQVCSAIDHAHSRRLAHTNLTPANIILEMDGTVKVLDYGLQTDPGESAKMGRNPEALLYLSPEQARGEEPTWCSNLFSLGVMLHEMISGSRPWEGEVAAVLDSILHRDPVPLHTLKSAVDPRTSKVILKVMAKSPAERHQSGADLIRDLENSQKPVAAPVVTPRKPVSSAPPPTSGAKPSPAANDTRAPHPVPLQVVRPTVDPRATGEVPGATLNPAEENHSAGPGLVRDSQENHPAVVPVMAPPMPERTAPAAKPVVDQAKPEGQLHVEPVRTPVSPPSPSVSKAQPVTQLQAESAVNDASPVVQNPALAEQRTAARVEAKVAVVAPEPHEFLIVGSHETAIPAPAAPQRRIISVKNLRLPAKDLRIVLYAAAALVLLLGGFLGLRAAFGGSSQQQEAVLTPAPAATAPPPQVETETEPQAEQDAVVLKRHPKKRKPSPPPAPAPVTTGQLRIDSSPPGALIQLDGQPASTLVTPYTAAALSAGSHIVVVSKSGFATESRTVTIAAGQQSSLAVSLKELAASVSVSSRPDGAAVFVDGNEIGRTTPVRLMIPKGRHTVVLRKAGFLESASTVELTPGQVTSLSPILAVLGNADEVKATGKMGRLFGRGTPVTMGKLQIKTNPKGAQVMLNQRVLEKKTPAEFTAPAGTYEVTLALPGHKTVQRIVTVNAGATAVVDESLQ